LKTRELRFSESRKIVFQVGHNRPNPPWRYQERGFFGAARRPQRYEADYGPFLRAASSEPNPWRRTFASECFATRESLDALAASDRISTCRAACGL
jgi:hypothetical protein